MEKIKLFNNDFWISGKMHIFYSDELRDLAPR